MTMEFKSQIQASGFKARIHRTVNELIAFANARDETHYFGIEDNGKGAGNYQMTSWDGDFEHMGENRCSSHGFMKSSSQTWIPSG